MEDHVEFGKMFVPVSLSEYEQVFNARSRSLRKVLTFSLERCQDCCIIPLAIVGIHICPRGGRLYTVPYCVVTILHGSMPCLGRGKWHVEILRVSIGDLVCEVRDKVFV